MSRAQIWDGTAWVSMTGGAGEGGEGVTNHADLLGVTASQHHTKYTDNEARSAVAGLYLPLASNAVSASKWATARTITLAGDASGSVSIDGSANKTLTVTVNNNSHEHTNYLLLAGGTMSGGFFATNGLVFYGYNSAPASGKDSYWFQSRNVKFQDSTTRPSDADGQDGDISLSYIWD